MKVLGIHHISNIVNHPQENIDFYAGMLGLRMVKRAVNFDDANSYHFYYGNHQADLGTVITSFPIGRDTKDGFKGGGQTTSTYYIIPEGSFDFWYQRIQSFNLHTSVKERFGKKHLIFSDYLGVVSELLEDQNGIVNTYEFNGVKKEHAIKGFYGAELTSLRPEETKDFFIKHLDAKLEIEDDNYYRLSYPSEIGKYIDIKKQRENRGRLSKGTVHHIALSVKDLESLKLLLKEIKELGFNVTDIKERDFFKAIYFREPGGIIIELSTMSPGFTNIDEEGKELYLPEHFEDQREELENTLVPIKLKEVTELKRYHYFNKQEYDLLKDHELMLKRINEIAKIAKERKLTKEELEERKILRAKYVKNISKNVANLVDNITFSEEEE